MAEIHSMCETLSRKEAIDRGLSYFFTGKPCKRGHIARRRVKSCNCEQCNKEWLAANPEKKRRYALNRISPERKKKQSIWNAARYERKKKEIDKKTSAWYWANREHCIARQKKYYRRKKKTHPQVFRAFAQNRRAKKLKNGGTHTPQDIVDIYKLQREKCAYCRTSLGNKYQVDHIVSLTNGGTNDRRNLQLLCKTCNLRKSSKDPITHAQSIGLLL